MPIAFNITIIRLSGLFIIWYFFVYPFMLNRKLNKKNEVDYAAVDAIEADTL